MSLSNIDQIPSDYLDAICFMYYLLGTTDADWSDILSLCAKCNDVQSIDYCLDRLFVDNDNVNDTDVLCAALTVAYEYESDAAIDRLFDFCCIDNVAAYFAVSCWYNDLFSIRYMLAKYEDLDLSLLKSLNIDAENMFKIIMIDPYTITREYFTSKNGVYDELDTYNHHSLIELKPFMHCFDMAREVSLYSNV